MRTPLSLFIGWRYTRAKRRNHFISFISLVSMLGIALGVAVLITVLSVMNGFDYEIQKRFFALQPELTATTAEAMNASWKGYKKSIEQVPGVVGVAPYVAGNAVIMRGSEMNALQVVGVEPQSEGQVSELAHKLVFGKLSLLKSGQYGMIMGKRLADNLGLSLGDRVTLLTPQTSVTLAGIFPRTRVFRLVGIFKTGNGFSFESSVVYIDLQDAARLFPPHHGYRGFHIKTNTIYLAPQLKNTIELRLPMGFMVSDWTQTAGAFFEALRLEKTMMFVILILIIAVAAFNLVATLMMVVNEKRADIAILRTLGANRRMILHIFIFQGAIIGLLGTLLGLVGGIVLALNATALVDWLQHMFHVQLIKSSVYFVDYLPSRVQLVDLVEVCGSAVLLSFVATLYPAWIAFRVQPAEALRYE